VERPASESERRLLTKHLRTDSNAATYADLIERGSLAMHVVTLPDPAALGQRETLFAILGRDDGARHAARLVSRPRFLVREAYAHSAASSGDEEAFSVLEGYVEDARRGRLREVFLTAVSDSAGTRLVDGNKRAIAIYEAAAAVFPLQLFELRPAVT